MRFLRDCLFVLFGILGAAFIFYRIDTYAEGRMAEKLAFKTEKACQAAVKSGQVKSCYYVKETE